MVPWWLMAILIFGVNFTLWGSIGLLRLLEGRGARWLARKPAEEAGEEYDFDDDLITVDDVAVLIPAHNEELVIEDSLRAVMAAVPARNVHVVSDGSTDATYEIARSTGARVIETSSNVGKAGALQEAISRFRIVERFRVVLLLDADTRVGPDYFEAGLPLFDDPRVVAVAGRVKSLWRRGDLSVIGKLLVCHRQRIYALTQYLLKFGQTWLRANATHIVPGFASMYRTEVLPAIEMNPPGLVIEDYNMTFEVYQKRLGKVGFTPSAIAVTQEPGTLRDYIRQTKRWALGLWQTVRLHPPRANLFTVMLALLLLELLSSSVLVVLLPLVVLVLLIPYISTALLALPGLGALHALVTAHFTLGSLLIGVVVPDLFLTIVVVVLQRQLRLLLFAWCFLPMRVLDAAVSLYAVPLAWLSKSTGRWRSPGRRADSADVTEELLPEKVAPDAQLG